MIYITYLIIYISKRFLELNIFIKYKNFIYFRFLFKKCDQIKNQDLNLLILQF